MDKDSTSSLMLNKLPDQRFEPGEPGGVVHHPLNLGLGGQVNVQLVHIHVFSMIGYSVCDQRRLHGK